MFGKLNIQFTEHEFRVKSGLKDSINIQFTEHEFRVKIGLKEKCSVY